MGISMTQEEKDLLLKDLCARLPYGVKCLVNYTFCNETTDYEDVEDSDIDTLISIEINQQIESYCFERLSEWFDVDEFKPYLFPLSSMTEEQEEEYNDLNGYELGCFPHTEEALDYLIKNYFDYRGLIPKGLAIDATGLNIY